MTLVREEISANRIPDVEGMIAAFEHRPPEIVFEWADRETDARGWAVINSLRGGAAGGGTRMRKGLDRREVESLAKTMEVKFTVSGPAIGGAKSGIDFDPADPRRDGVLQRWFEAVTPLLKNYYGTGGDLNVDELADVIPLTERNGLWHPQEGVVRGHFNPTVSEQVHKIGQLRTGVVQKVESVHHTPDPARHYTVSDLITGWGVSEATRHFYRVYGGNLAGKSVIVQGWGNVGASAAYYVAQAGARVVGIIDRGGGIIAPDGLSFDQVRQLYLDKFGNTLVADGMLSFEQVNERIWDVGAEIFLPCAASRLVTQQQTERLVQNGLELIVSGANVPFADPEIFFGPTYAQADKLVSVVPDFIANCGMARAFAYLMAANGEISAAHVFADVSETVGKAIQACHAKSDSKTGLARTAFYLALKDLL